MNSTRWSGLSGRDFIFGICVVSTNVYKKRMLTLKEKLMQIAPNGYVSGEEAGLHLLFHIPGVRETDVVLAAARRGLSVHGLSEYCHSQSISKQEAVLVLGFCRSARDRNGSGCENFAAEHYMRLINTWHRHL